MTAAWSGADTVTFSAVGFVLIIAIVVVWRILVHDKTIARIRFGVFYERERERDTDEEDERTYTYGETDDG